MIWTWLVLAVLLGIAAPLFAGRYLAHLPWAPECPACRGITAETGRAGPFDRLCALLAATPVRSCERCGWAGRMRWRVARERVRSGGHHHRPQ